MTTYILRRSMHAVLVILLVSIIAFLLIHLLPGDPVLLLLTSGESQEITPEQIENMRHELGMDRPLIVQYVDWLAKAVRGDLGQSIQNKSDVAKEIARRLPITLHLGISAFILGIVIGPLLGVLSAIRRGKWIDTLVTIVANIGITAPQFWLGILMIYFFGLYLNVLPIYGYTSPLENFVESFRQSIMPIIALAMFPIASAARHTRAMVIEVMQQDYIRTAWAKGLSERVIVTRHVLKNALMPVITLQGLLFRNIIGGSIVVETVFFIPGMGRLIVNSILVKDYPVVLGCTLVIAIAVVVMNLLVDLGYGLLDPRIQYD